MEVLSIDDIKVHGDLLEDGLYRFNELRTNSFSFDDLGNISHGLSREGDISSRNSVLANGSAESSAGETGVKHL